MAARGRARRAQAAVLAHLRSTAGRAARLRGDRDALRRAPARHGGVLEPALDPAGRRAHAAGRGSARQSRAHRGLAARRARERCAEPGAGRRGPLRRRGDRPPRALDHRGLSGHR